MPGPFPPQRNARLQLKKSLKARGPLGPGRRVGQYRKAGLKPPPPPGQLKAKQGFPKPVNSVVQQRPAVTRPSFPDRTPSGVQGIAQPKPRPIDPGFTKPFPPGLAKPFPGRGNAYGRRMKKADRILGKKNAPKKARRWANRVQGKGAGWSRQPLGPITYR